MATVIERLRELFNGCDHNRANCYGTCKCDGAVRKAMPALLALYDAEKGYQKDPDGYDHKVKAALADLEKEAT